MEKQTHTYGPSGWSNKMLCLGVLKTTAPEAIFGHLKTLSLPAPLLLTRCPSPISLWCAAWRPSCGHGWGGPPAPASSGPGFHSSRAKVGGTNPPHSSVEAGNGGEGREKEKNEWRTKESQSKEGVKGKLTRRKDRMRMTDKKMKIYGCIEPPKNTSENKVSEYTLESQIDIKRKRATQREKETEGLKMDLCKLASVSCCFLPQMYALWSASIHQLNLISTPDSLIGYKHNQSN